MVCERSFTMWVCVCVRWYVSDLSPCECVCVWSYGMWEMVCDKVMCVWVCCVKVMCVWVCVKLWYVKFVCVKVLYVKLLYCMWEMGCDILYVKLLYVKFVCVWSYGMWEMVCDILYVKLLYVKFVCVREAAGGWGGGGGGARDTESKTRTPHKVVGNYPFSQKNLDVWLKSLKEDTNKKVWQLSWLLCECNPQMFAPSSWDVQACQVCPWDFSSMHFATPVCWLGQVPSKSIWCWWGTGLEICCFVSLIGQGAWQRQNIHWCTCFLKPCRPSWLLATTPAAADAFCPAVSWLFCPAASWFFQHGHEWLHEHGLQTDGPHHGASQGFGCFTRQNAQTWCYGEIFFQHFFGIPF